MMGIKKETLLHTVGTKLPHTVSTKVSIHLAI